MQKTDGPEWLTVQKLKVRFGVSEPTMRRWIVDERNNFPKPIVVARRLFFRTDEIEAWAKSRERDSAH